MARKRRPIRRLLTRTVPFAIIGGAIGVPLSYQVQNSLVRGLVSRRDYTRQVFTAAPNAMFDQIRSKGGSPDPLGIVERLTFVVTMSAVTGAIAGLYLTRGK